MSAEVRRSLFLAILGLLAGLGLVAALFGGGAYLKRVSTAPAPVAEAEPPRIAALPPSDKPEPGKAEGGKAEGNRAAGAPEPASNPAADAAAPSFDIVRIEPNGEAVVAGRAAPNTVVELLVDGKPVAKALADPGGQFAIVPPALPAGNSEIVLRGTGADGREIRSRDSVAVAVAKGRDAKPLVAITSPDKPTVVLSQPEPAKANPGMADAGKADSGMADPGRGGASGKLAQGKDAAGQDQQHRAASGKDARGVHSPGRTAADGTADKHADRAAAEKPGARPSTAAAAPVKVVSVDAQEGGRLFVTGQAPPGATVRLYLNDTLIAPSSVGSDGKVTFTIGRGVKPGAYTVRIDQVDPVSGKVRSRAEVPFAVPEPVAVAARPADKPAPHAAEAGRPHPQVGAMAEARPPQGVPAPQGPTQPGKTGQGSASQGAVAQGSGSQTSGSQGAVQPGSGAQGLPTPAALDPPKPAPTTPGGVFVPEINTAKIIRGDSLWEISRRTYGTGDRYTVIYDANQDQIRNPDLIYPGQIFVLPGDAGRDGRRG